MKKKLYIFWSWGFIIALVVLLLNDHVLKTIFNNGLTGKLSDVAGLFVFPIFFAVFFPAFKKHIYWATAVLFIFFKSPWADVVITWWNVLPLLHISRVADPTDLFALAILPISYQYFIKKQPKKFRFHPLPIIILAAVGFIATSRSPRVPITYNQDYVFQYPIDTLRKKIFFHPNITNNSSRVEWLKLDSIEKNTPVYPPKHLIKRKKELFDTYCNRTIYINLKDTAHICNDQTVAIILRQNRQISTLQLLETRYRYCDHIEGKEDKDLLKEIFEREIIKKLYE